MTTDRELTRKLAALTQSSIVEDGVLQLGDLSGEDALAAVLEAIDNTMLPRHLVFSAGDASVSLAVGGRRLRALIEASDGVPIPADLAGKQLTRDDEAELKAVASAIESLAQHGPLGLVRDDKAQVGGQSDTGVGLKRLSEIWGADPYAVPLPLAEKFLAALGQTVLARRVIEPADEGADQGDETLLAAASEAYDATLKSIADGHGKLYPAAIGSRFLSKEGLMPGEEILTLVELDGVVLIVVTSEGSWAEISSAWPLR